jgi:hypothetical protein
MAATSATSKPESFSSIATSEQQMLEEQQQAYAQQEQTELQSAIMQSKHDTMMAIIRAIAS